VVPYQDTHSICDARTGWAVKTRRFDGVPIETQYRKDASTCYATVLNIPSGRIEMAHRDGSGPIAVSKLSSSEVYSRSVWCGPYTSTAGLDPAAAYVENVAAPECVAWERTYLDWTSCRSQTPGSCSAL
jgi:hypothetical protein